MQMRMLAPALAAALFCGARPAYAQKPVPSDSARHAADSARADSLATHAQQLQSVTITATPATREQPVSAINITPHVIQTTPALDPWDVFRVTAGVEVHDQGQGPGFASDASVRGFSSDHSTDIALWIDGVPINEPVNGHAEGYNDWSVIMPSAIQDADVIEGPVSALYGNFALAGVVNIRTLRQMQGTQAWLSGGANGRAEATLLTGFDRDAGSGVLGFRGVREDGWRPNSAYALGQGHARAVRELSPNTTVDAGIELYGSRWDSPGFITADQLARERFDTVANSSDGGFKRRAQERVSLRMLRGTSLWRSTLYATQGRWQLFLTIPPEPGEGEGSGSQTEEEDARYGFGATSALTMVLPFGELTVGGEGRYDHSHFQNWLTTNRQRDESQFLVRANQLSGALFLQSRLDAGRRLSFQLGGRYDLLRTHANTATDPASTDTHGIFSPKLGAIATVAPHLRAFANVSRGFRSPDGIITDPSLRFIREWAYESGLKVEREALFLSASVFRLDVNNEQTFDPILLKTTNGGASRRNGVEVQAQVPVGRNVHALANWTWTDAKYRHFMTEDGDDLSGARVFNTAEYVGSAAVELAPVQRPWTVRLSGNWVGPYAPFDAPGVLLGGYGLAHLSGTYRIHDVVLNLGIRNLFDRVYPELRAGDFVSPGQPISVFGGLRYAF